MFRPCIDLHRGLVKQIVGKSLTNVEQGLNTNFVSDKSAKWYVKKYKKDKLKGGHIIMLGEGNETACIEALEAYPKGMQVGGGINENNAEFYIKSGASHIIVTSYIFYNGKFNEKRLKKLSQKIGKERLVIDLSCRRIKGQYIVFSDLWEKQTDFIVNKESLIYLSQFCSEFLVHSIDVEGLCQGIDYELVLILKNSLIPVTYAGGGKSINDLYKIQKIGMGKVDLTIGSALDIFGGNLITYNEAVAFNNKFEI